MSVLPRSARPVSVVAAAIVLSACQGAASVAPSPSASASVAPAGAVATLEDVKSATIQIEAEGTFVDPEYGLIQNAAGRGSGFLVDPSGLAVTNNHVVTGAALLQVWVGGESEPRNARVLAVSECSDLAVIDIEGDGYPFLEWYDGEITAGLDIYVAGFPLGDPEYTLTEGIVSKENADGETNWASVDSVIEHSAATNPGNSGGPVITPDGKVVGVHYAGDPDARQQFAIGRDEAVPVIERLREGQDVDAIGINGQAVMTEDGSTSGVWVASVESGTQADQTGMEAGDLLYRLEGLVLATDGTMADYCDILRSHTAGDPLAVEVLRTGSGEVLGGTLNQDELAVLSRPQPEPSDGGGGGAGYTDFEEVSDDTGAISVVVPVEWSDRSGTAWVYNEAEVGVTVVAAPDIDAWYAGWDQPGVFFGASASLSASYDVTMLLDENMFTGECEYTGRYPYEDPYYTGMFDEYLNCGGLGTTFYVIAAEPADGSFLMLLQVSLVGAADDEALTNVLNTFQVVGTLP
ncbi:MAG: S1C family serine protease [Candidatus Limnocylindria bacterium]